MDFGYFNKAINYIFTLFNEEVNNLSYESFVMGCILLPCVFITLCIIYPSFYYPVYILFNYNVIAL